MSGILAPWDAGVRFETDDVNVKCLKGPYLLVRWTERWGRDGSAGAQRCARFAMTSPGLHDGVR